MKNTFIALMSVMASASAAVITATNSSGFSTNQIADENGDLLNGASVSLGFFDDSVSDMQIASITTSEELDVALDSFVELANATTQAITLGPANLSGVFSITDSTTDLANDQFGGVNLSLVITSDTGAFVYTFADALPSVEPSVVGLNLGGTEPSAGTILLGSVGDSVVTFGATSTTTFNLTEISQVPEPTSGMLLGLAGLALVARRKR